ncbi:putative trichohyalin-like, partial [Triplophysa rosa]
VILVYAHSDSKILQEAQVFNVSSRVKQTNAKRKKKHLGSDTEIIQEAQVCLPQEDLEEHRLSTTHQPGRRGEGTTAVKRNRKGKTTTLRPETRVTLGSRKSKGAASVINPKSTQFTPTTDTPEQSLSPHGWVETGLPVEAAFDSKGYSESAGGAEDAEHSSSVKKIKQTSKSKRKTVEIQKDDETKYRVFEDNTATSKQYTFNLQKKKKTKEIAETTESQNTKVKTKKKKKGQPAFVVGKPRTQEVEWKAIRVDESERQTPETYERETYEEFYYATHQREVLSHNTDDDDDELDKSVSQEQKYTDSEDDMDADTDSVSTEAHEAQDSPRSAYTAQRSHYSQFSVRSHPSTHQLSQSSHRTTSVGMVAQCSPAPLSLIHLPPQTAQHPATDPTKSQSGNNVKSSEEPNAKKQVDTKAAALAKRAERQRLEVERKRKGKEEEKRRQQEKEATEERVRMELEEEQNKRADEARLRKIREEEERQRRQREEMEIQRRVQAEKERERRRQEEKKRLVERLQKERQDEEKRQAGKYIPAQILLLIG